MAMSGIAPALRGGAMAMSGIAPALRGGAMADAGTGPAGAAFVPALVQGEGALAHWLDTLALLYTRGAATDWRALDAPFQRSKLSLPTYPFERARCWLDFPERTLRPSTPAVIDQPSPHPLFGRVRVHVADRSGFIRRPGAGASGRGTGSTG
jgi:acyl transferase domain-containing protein